MNNRRQKVSHPNKTILLPQQQPFFTFTNNHRHPSGHTKISTNCTIHSTAPFHRTPQTKVKNKGNKASSKPIPMNGGLRLGKPKSKRRPNTNEISRKEQVECQFLPQQSYREYLVMNEYFVPITSKDQLKLLDNMLAQTASTIYDSNHISSLDNAQHNTKHLKQLRKRTLSRQSLEENEPNKVAKCQKSQPNKGGKCDKAISNIHSKGYACVEVSATPDYCEIGMQYSQRTDQIQQQIKKSQQTKQDSQTHNDSLSDLLFKLQFTHLVDDHSFTSLTLNEKQHFVQLLQTFAFKLKPHQQSSKDQLKQMLLPQSSVSTLEPGRLPSNIGQEEALIQNMVSFERLEILIRQREYRQLNWKQHSQQLLGDLEVNTSLMGVLPFLCHLFSYIQTHTLSQFIFQIRKMFGFSFRQKYKRVTRHLPFTQDHPFRVVHQSVFEGLINQADSEYQNYNQIMHLKVLFDAFNEHLEEYRPYYLANGQPFPWAFKMFTTMSEYSIDEDSIPIIFRQAKDKIVDWATHLCGLIVDHNEPALPYDNPLRLRRHQKESRLMLSWICEQNFQKDGIDLFSTQVLHLTAQIIFSQLVEQCRMEVAFLFN